MTKRLGALALVLALVAVGCGDDDDEAAGGDGETYAVQIDGDSPDLNVAMFAYFPRDVRAHAGDTIEFNLVDTGEPHTVTFGSLVDAGMAKLDPDAEEEQEIPELSKLPDLLPEGPGDAIQAAAQPCFLASGDPPESDACTEQQQEQPEFDGTQTYYNSGWVAPDDVFSVTLADDIEPGTYNYLCLLHREFMSGKVTVVDDDTDVPTPDEVSERGQQELTAEIAKLDPAKEQLQGATADKAIAGAGVDDPNVRGMVVEFAPKEAAIRVGGSVSWSLTGVHTISFNAPEDAKPLLVRDADGAVHINQKGVAPSNSPGQPPPPEGEGGEGEGPPEGGDDSGPPPEPVVIDGGRFDGTAFVSPGVLFGGGPAGPIYKLTFTRAGTFTYQCLVHPDMEGTVKVG